MMIPDIEQLSPADVDRSVLVPHQYIMRNGRKVYYFPDTNIDLVKVDLIFEAGTALQEKFLQSASAIQLVTEGTSRRTARDIAEFMDFRGIVMEKSNDTVSSTLTVYSLVRHMDELVPLLYEMVSEAAYPDEEFAVYLNKRRQGLLTNLKKTSYRAREEYYRSLFGAEHPQGRFASVDDIDNLTVDDVRLFHRRYLTPSRLTIVLGGNVDNHMLGLFDDTFGSVGAEPFERVVLAEPHTRGLGVRNIGVEGAVQNTLRVGRILPFRWDDADYARFMVLSTLLGGYFGSRLMSNIREEKGYTYGISSVTQISRGSIVFYIVTDVACDNAAPAMQEIRREIGRLCDEPVPDDELELVRNYMVGDFMRGIDGIFERSERFCQMLVCGVSELFTDNLMKILEPGAVTPASLQEMARKVFDPTSMVYISAGR